MVVQRTTHSRSTFTAFGMFVVITICLLHCALSLSLLLIYSLFSLDFSSLYGSFSTIFMLIFISIFRRSFDINDVMSWIQFEFLGLLNLVGITFHFVDSPLIAHSTHQTHTHT